MKTITFNNVYVKSNATVVGPMEANGPLKSYFDKTYDDLYCGETSFEKAERKLVLDACDLALRKVNVEKEDIELILGGDLLNQIETSNYIARDFHTSFIGMYAACATSSLIIGNASVYVDKLLYDHVLCFTSSHNLVAERLFRYPNEYGIQKKLTTTYTVSGAGALLLTNKKTNIKVNAFTIGNVVDWHFKDANDMGSAMAPAAYETIMNHIQNTNSKIEEYDLIVTGDLSKVGYKFLCDLLNDKHKYKNVYDCGLMIYDINSQDVFCGGSGCACSMCVSLAYLFSKLKDKTYKKILVVATGALLSTTSMAQKESIPCIAHAIEYERCK